MEVAICSVVCLVDVGAAAPDGGCASRQRPRDPWRADASWGGAVCLHGLGGCLVSLCGEAVGSVDAPPRRWLDF
jgi:hypothetical protein